MLKIERKVVLGKNDPRHCVLWVCFVGFCLSAWLCSSSCRAVTSKIVRHKTSADFLKGQTKNVVVGSKGTLQLGRAWRKLADEFENVWSINCILVNGDTIFLGTSPNGAIYKYSLGELTKIYPPQPRNNKEEQAGGANDANAVTQQQHLANEHIFAMTTDMAGRLVVGISGSKPRLLRFDGDRTETIFEPNDARYIFALVTDDKGNIYMGTGPEGKIYRYDPFNPAETGLVYDSPDKNILSLAAGEDGFIYAGSDTRGLIYKIEPRTKKASVLYDSDQPEITALLFGRDGRLYAAATSAKIVEAETQFAAQSTSSGRPEPGPSDKNQNAQEQPRSLKIPNTQDSSADKSGPSQAPAHKPALPGQASYIYKIDNQGFVTEVFSEKAVFFCLAAQKEALLLGTGNNGRLFLVEPDTERQAVIYEDKHASQITAVATIGEDIYIGTANPARLIKLSGRYASEGIYSSELVDAGQPAKWGKLQIDADVPPGCRILLASRSGNVKDVNDPTFSDWTEPAEITGPVQLRCPLGRFCQYKLILQSNDTTNSPLVREVAVACTVPNLAPKVESVKLERISSPGKKGVFKISYSAKDDNSDKLIYKIDFRKLGRSKWIKVKDEIEEETFEWDSKTVEDGRYEIRVTASDERSNTAATKLTASRISDPVIVDNTGPVIKDRSIEKNAGTVTIKLRVVDRFSAIGKLEYTIDSNAQWKGTLPDDFVYDTTDESFTIVIEDLKPGEHIIALKVSDQLGNTTYESFDVQTEGD